jgi:predicted porin
MKKIFCLTILLVLVTSAFCAASPLPDCSLGQVALDLNLSAPDLSGSKKVDGKQNVGYGVTAGLGFGFAGQYTYNDFKTKTSLNGSSEIKAQQICLVDNLVDIVANVSIFGGVSQIQAVGSSKHNGVVVGVAANVPIAPNTKAYGVLSTGNRISGYEVGLSYELAKTTDLSIGYRDNKYKDITFSDSTKSDVTAKGIVGGLTFKI